MADEQNQAEGERNQCSPSRRIPPVYQNASWRNVTPVDSHYCEIGLGFDLADGSVTRLRVSVLDAKAIAGSITDYVREHETGVPAYRFDSQSEISSGIPRVDGSTPDEGKSV